MKELLNYLKDEGKILIGDIAFETRDEWYKCKEKSSAEWDSTEIYCIAEELRTEFPNLCFEKITFCSGVLIISR